MNNDQKPSAAAMCIACEYLGEHPDHEDALFLAKKIDAELAAERKAAEEMRTLLSDLADIIEDEQPYRVKIIKKCVATYDAARKGE